MSSLVSKDEKKDKHEKFLLFYLFLLLLLFVLSILNFGDSQDFSMPELRDPENVHAYYLI